MSSCILKEVRSIILWANIAAHTVTFGSGLFVLIRIHCTKVAVDFHFTCLLNKKWFYWKKIGKRLKGQSPGFQSQAYDWHPEVSYSYINWVLVGCSFESLCKMRCNGDLSKHLRASKLKDFVSHRPGSHFPRFLPFLMTLATQI